MSARRSGSDDWPDNLTDDQRLLRKVDDLTHEVRQVRWYLGLLCLFAAVALFLFVLVLLGVITVEFKPVSPSRF
jgi:hypothetical protein